MEQRLCENGCGTPLAYQKRFCSRECYAESMYGKPRKTGVSITRSGYRRVEYGDNRGRLEHVVVMEDILGRPLQPHERVHHKDRNRQNNMRENLEVRDKSDHAREHGKEWAAKRIRNKNGTFAPNLIETVALRKEWND